MLCQNVAEKIRENGWMRDTVRLFAGLHTSYLLVRNKKGVFNGSIETGFS
jgi:hypothetical protein